MSNCLSKNTKVLTLNENKIIESHKIKVGDYILDVNLQYKKVAKIEYFNNVDCFEVSSKIGFFSRVNVIFSKEHFSKKNLKKINFLHLKERQTEVVAFFDENNKEIETLPFGFIHCFL